VLELVTARELRNRGRWSGAAKSGMAHGECEQRSCNCLAIGFAGASSRDRARVHDPAWCPDLPVRANTPL
jgi:hypothetical protein